MCGVNLLRRSPIEKKCVNDTHGSGPISYIICWNLDIWYNSPSVIVGGDQLPYLRICPAHYNLVGPLQFNEIWEIPFPSHSLPTPPRNK